MELESKLLTRNIEGVLQTTTPVFLTGATAATNLKIAPRQALPVITRTLSFTAVPASGAYEIGQTLGAIVDVPYKPETGQDADLVYRSNAPLNFGGNIYDRRDIGPRTDYDLSATDFTLSLWLQPDPFATYGLHGVLGYRSGEINGYPSIQQIGTTLRFGYGTGSTWVQQDLAGAMPVDGKWHHLVISFDRVNGSSNSVATVYVDNVNAGALNFGSSRPGSGYQQFDVGRTSQTAKFRFDQFDLACEADGIGDGEYDINYYTPKDGANTTYWTGTGTDGARFTLPTGWRTFEDTAFISVCENDTNGSDHSTCDGDDDLMIGSSYLPWILMSTADPSYALAKTQRFSTNPVHPACGFWTGYDDTATLTYTFANNSTPYIGDLEDVRLYRRALSGSDVTNLYQGTSVLARFKFDERPGATLFADGGRVRRRELPGDGPAWARQCGRPLRRHQRLRHRRRSQRAGRLHADFGQQPVIRRMDQT